MKINFLLLLKHFYEIGADENDVDLLQEFVGVICIRKQNSCIHNLILYSLCKKQFDSYTLQVFFFVLYLKSDNLSKKIILFFLLAFITFLVLILY